MMFTNIQFTTNKQYTMQIVQGHIKVSHLIPFGVSGSGQLHRLHMPSDIQNSQPSLQFDVQPVATNQ